MNAHLDLVQTVNLASTPLDLINVDLMTSLNQKTMIEDENFLEQTSFSDKVNSTAFQNMIYGIYCNLQSNRPNRENNKIK